MHRIKRRKSNIYREKNNSRGTFFGQTTSVSWAARGARTVLLDRARETALKQLYSLFANPWKLTSNCAETQNNERKPRFRRHRGCSREPTQATAACRSSTTPSPTRTWWSDGLGGTRPVAFGTPGWGCRWIKTVSTPIRSRKEYTLRVRFFFLLSAVFFTRRFSRLKNIRSCARLSLFGNCREINSVFKVRHPTRH